MVIRQHFKKSDVVKVLFFQNTEGFTDGQLHVFHQLPVLITVNDTVPCYSRGEGCINMEEKTGIFLFRREIYKGPAASRYRNNCLRTILFIQCQLKSNRGKPSSASDLNSLLTLDNDPVAD